MFTFAAKSSSDFLFALSRILFALLPFFVTLLVTGCGQATPQKTYAVSGEIFVQGQPASGARLALQPAAAADLQLWPRGFPFAIVEPDGKFRFSCYAENDGAPAGDYKLLVTWIEGDGIPNEDPAAPKPKNRVDAKYGSAQTTPLSVTVEQKSHQIPRIEIP